MKANPEAILLRVAWLYGKKGPDFVSSIMDKLRAGSTRIQAVEDQFGSPTSIADLCTHIPYFIERENVKGVFHLVNEGCVSRLEMAKVIADEFGSVCEVCGVTSKNFPRPAKRPKNTSLRSLRLQEAKLPPMPNWEASLREFVRKNQKAPE
nr:sugar nucleotide-binding protein [Turicimonas muris]